MSYLVLARKYRSGDFDDVIGQDHVAQTLKRAIESDRIAHAFLFCGTRGVGKTSMARILAKALNCETSDKPTPNPCGKCASCAAIARGEDIDVIEIDAASNTGVDNVRDIIANAQFHPARSRFKVYIIDETHMLSKQAFNALLKTLEEPPGHVKFILATTEPEKILPTILSRCQRYDFRNIPTREIAGHLREICKKEKIKAEDEALLLIGKAGAGSMRDALSLLDRLLSFGEKNLTVEMIEQLLGMPRSQAIHQIVESMGGGDVKRVLELADAQVRGGMSPDTLLAGLIDHLRNLLIVRTCGVDSQLVEVPGLTPDELEQQAARFEPTILSGDIAILEELRRSLRSSVAGRALLDATLARLALAGQFTSIEQLLQSVNGGAAPASPRPPASTPPPTAPALKKNDEPRVTATAIIATAHAAKGAGADIKPLSGDDVDGIWRQLLQLLSAKRAGLPALLQGARLIGIEDGTAVIRFDADHETMMRSFDRNGKKETIASVLTQMLERNVGVRLELGTAAAAPAEPPRVVDAPRPPAGVRRSPAPPALAATALDAGTQRLTPEMKEALRADPLVAAAIQHLGAEIVKVE